MDSSGAGIELTITERLAVVRERMLQAVKRSGRSAEQVSLLAVSKLQPFSAIEEAYAAGQRDFGENRVEELWEKVETTRERGLGDIRWHMIGSIQSRKTSRCVGPFELIHSVDRLRIASRLSRDAHNAGQPMDVLLEVNVSAEESKHGFDARSLHEAMPEIAALPGIRVHGLMTMAPIAINPEEVRPCFVALRELRDELAAAYPEMDWNQLSMGMTQDYEVAVEEGATIVRVGSAIFGARPAQG